MSRNSRAGALDKLFELTGKSGIASAIAGSTPHLVIAIKMAEFMINEVLSKASTEVDTPKFFDAYEQLSYAKRLLEVHSGGFESMSPAIQQGYRTTLDRATTLFREAKGGLKEEAKLLRPIYMLHEVITLLLNGNREEALIAAKGIEAEYKAQKPLYDKLDERYKGISIADDDNVYHNRAFSARAKA